MPRKVPEKMFSLFQLLRTFSLAPSQVFTAISSTNEKLVCHKGESAGVTMHAYTSVERKQVSSAILDSQSIPLIESPCPFMAVLSRSLLDQCAIGKNTEPLPIVLVMPIYPQKPSTTRRTIGSENITYIKQIGGN